jgi:hypothetical protein
LTGAHPEIRSSSSPGALLLWPRPSKMWGKPATSRRTLGLASSILDGVILVPMLTDQGEDVVWRVCAAIMGAGG